MSRLFTGPKWILLFAVIIIFLVLSQSGCEAVYRRNPEKTAAKFFEYMFDGDIGSAQKLCTERVLFQTHNGENAFNELRDYCATERNEFTLKDLIADKKGRHTAEVFSRRDGAVSLILVNINRAGYWEIDEIIFGEDHDGDDYWRPL